MIGNWTRNRVIGKIRPRQVVHLRLNEAEDAVLNLRLPSPSGLLCGWEKRLRFTKPGDSLAGICKREDIATSYGSGSPFIASLLRQK